MPHSETDTKREAGFTLAELLVVLTIMSLALLITAPAFSRALGSNSDRVALERFQFTLEQARRIAERTGQETVFVLDVDIGSYRIVGQPVSGKLPEDWSIDATTARVEQVSDAEVGIRYWPGGASTGGEITLSNSGRKVLIKTDWLTGLTVREEPEQQ